MSTGYLKRHLAPFDATIWGVIEEETKEVLGQQLTGRKIVDVEGPKGLGFSSLNIGGRAKVASAGKKTKTKSDATELYVRNVLPVFELVNSFEVSKEDIEGIYRGSDGLKDTDSLYAAAKSLASAENRLILSGMSAYKLPGVLSESPSLNQAGDFAGGIAEMTVKAIEVMRDNHINGPFTMLLNYDDYAKVLSTPGYPLAKTLLSVLGEGGRILPDSEAGAQVSIISTRGGDYKLHLGSDVAIGYIGENDTHVELFLMESCTFEVVTPEACVMIKHK